MSCADNWKGTYQLEDTLLGELHQQMLPLDDVATWGKKGKERGRVWTSYRIFHSRIPLVIRWTFKNDKRMTDVSVGQSRRGNLGLVHLNVRREIPPNLVNNPGN